jgi:membrane-associated protease RseP (regulator of RpoE activity)
MKTKTLAMIAACGLLPITGFAQTPPAPPAPPNQPNQPIPPIPPKDKDKDKDRDKGPKVPVTFLGVETSSVPRVVSEQLNLPKGFGLVVDYVVPDGPAAAAGVQQNDIIKMFNDQILMEPDQLAKLVRSYPDGTNVTLTILRKNAETKVTVKLGKKEVRQREHDFGMFNMDDMNEKMQQAMNEKMKNFKFDFNNSNFGPDIRETVRNAQREAARATAEARREARRAAEEARRSAREMRLFSRDKGAMKSTTIDLGKATIVFTDDKGEMKIETVNGKKILTAKDPQGRLLFSGPVDDQEELDKVPVEVRQRYDKLENKDLPGVVPNTFVENDENADNDNDNDNDENNDNDNDNDNDNGDTGVDVSRATMQQVSYHSCPRTVRNLNIVSI